MTDDPLLGEGLPMLHSRCGRPVAEHPTLFHFDAACPFPPLPEREFARDTEPRVRVVGLPDTELPPTHPVMTALADLAAACREAYGMGVEVAADDHLDEVRDALDLIRRRLDL